MQTRRTRTLVLRVERGEELPAALIQALDRAEARSGWVQGTGIFEAAEIVLFDPAERAYERPRRLESPTSLLALSGSIATLGGLTTPRLTVTLARETDAGLEVLGGELGWARALSVELTVTVFDDLNLVRVADEGTGLPMLTDGPPVQPPQAALFDAPAPDSTQPASQHAPSPAGIHTSANTGATPAAPPRRIRADDDVDVYPEAGDHVSHFHFGECVVVDSDGDRIRLRQARDGRVREVSLTMLKIEPPTIDPETGARAFRLGRKH